MGRAALRFTGGERRCPLYIRSEIRNTGTVPILGGVIIGAGGCCAKVSTPWAVLDTHQDAKAVCGRAGCVCFPYVAGLTYLRRTDQTGHRGIPAMRAIGLVTALFAIWAVVATPAAAGESLNCALDDVISANSGGLAQIIGQELTPKVRLASVQSEP